MIRLVTLLVLYHGSVGLGQSLPKETAIRNEPRCATCQIELRASVTLRPEVSLPPQADPRPFSVRRQAGSGHFVIVAGDRSVSLHDSAGGFVRVIGQRGAGPGEFRGPQHALAVSGDTLLIIDPYNARLSVMSPKGDFVSSSSFVSTSLLDVTVLPSGELALNAVVREPDHIGYPLHIVTREGRLIRSLGTDRPDFRYGGPPTWRRRIAGARRTGLWVAREFEYVLEQWNVETGEQLAALRRLNSQLTSDQDYGQLPTPTRPPQSYIGSARLTTDNLLWVLIIVPDEHWSRGLAPTPVKLHGGLSYHPVTNYDLLYDTVIEIIDPQDGHMVTSRRIQQYLLAFVDDDHVTGYRESDDGDVLLDVFEIRLTRGR